jgi:photosystem II stability/assembly factor-like uncharacterized protein
MADVNDRAWAATRKGLFELRRRGDGWEVTRVSFLAEPASMLLPPDDDGRMLVALNLGHYGTKLHASDDAGETWREVATPAYPEQPAGAEGPPWKLVQVWALERAGDDVWCGTLPGGLFRSGDFGVSWQLVEPLWRMPQRVEWFGGGAEVPGIHSICPHPRHAGELLVGVSCGGAWVTRDGGEQWQVHASGMRAAYMPPEQADNPNAQDPHRIVRCPAAPDVLWCQHHNGIFRSTDNAASWHELSAPVSSFGFAVAVHPAEPDTAWFVPAQSDEKRVPVGGALAVNRTRDGGRNFETLREGLPQSHCYDLVYRHALDVAADGRSLLIGSTSGGVWTSNDAGERWQALPARLPPVYAVRFG